MGSLLSVSWARAKLRYTSSHLLGVLSIYSCPDNHQTSFPLTPALELFEPNQILPGQWLFPTLRTRHPILNNHLVWNVNIITEPGTGDYARYPALCQHYAQHYASIMPKIRTSHGPVARCCAQRSLNQWGGGVVHHQSNGKNLNCNFSKRLRWILQIFVLNALYWGLLLRETILPKG